MIWQPVSSAPFTVVALVTDGKSLAVAEKVRTEGALSDTEDWWTTERWIGDQPTGHKLEWQPTHWVNILEIG